MKLLLVAILLFGGQSFHVKLIHQLSVMLNVTPPAKITIEYLTQKELQDEYKGMVFQGCWQGNVARVGYCANLVHSQRVYVHGVWVPEKDPTHLHIKIHKDSGIDSLVHEFLHWYLWHLTKPPGVLNVHEVVNPLTDALLTSPELIAWFEKEQR